MRTKLYPMPKLEPQATHFSPTRHSSPLLNMSYWKVKIAVRSTELYKGIQLQRHAS